MPSLQERAAGEAGPAARAAVLGTTAAGAALTHALAVLAASARTPDSYPLSHAISELGMSGQPHAALANLGGMVIPGVLATVSAVAAANSLPVTGRARLGLASMGVAGASLIVAGLIPFPAAAHLAAALGAAAACALALALFAPWAAAYLGRPVWSTTGIGCALLLAFDVFAWIFAEGLGHPLHGWMGLEQRAASLAAFGWWGICGVALARRSA